MALKLMFITNEPEIAKIAERNGTDWIFIDLETLGKEERQKGRDSVKSNHTINDILKINQVLTKSKLLVRINPINPNSKSEIEGVIANGADILMLPMWKSLEDVSIFLNLVNGRTESILLLETKEAIECLDDVLNLKGIDGIHIGLNDLHLSMNLNFMFELISNGTVEKLCSTILKNGIKCGFGGIAKIGEGELAAEKIIIEHYRLGSTMVILSRSFCNVNFVKDYSQVEDIFKNNITKLREFEKKISKLNKNELEVNHIDIIKQIDLIVRSKK